MFKARWSINKLTNCIKSSNRTKVGLIGVRGRRYYTGLFGHPLLTSAQGFVDITNKTLQEAKVLVNEVTRSSDPNDVVKLFDELSDVLCRAADLAECIRLLHPQQDYVEHAQRCCSQIGLYVEQLNTHKGLHEALKKVLGSENLEEDTRRNAASLMHDFEISGIHLSSGDRERVVALNEHILSLSHAFVSNCNHPVLVSKDKLPVSVQDHFTIQGDYCSVDHIPHTDSETVRGLSYLMYHSAATEQSEVLDKLLLARNELANLVGYESFAQRTLKDSMAGSPENVLTFLNALSERLLPLAKEEVEEMLALKSTERNASGRFNNMELHPWDLTWLTMKGRRKLLKQTQSNLERYFSLDSCLQGVDHLFSSLFGLSLKQQPLEDGEVWDDSVQKYAFMSNNEVLGQLYCDFFHRPTKLNSDCQFTIQGCRKLRDGSYQMPVSTLNLSLPPVKFPHLSQQAVENLFHEMGHAVHSVLGRTRYQNISGTRCPTDFAEIPSNLMELFLQDKRVLESFAKNVETGETLPEEKMLMFKLSNNLFPALTAQIQILYSIMDQSFHGSDPLKRPTTQVFSELHKQYSPIKYIENTAWYLRFTHLYTYAGKYYSYLWSRSVANLIWRQCFRQDPFSSVIGELYKGKMLAYGGGVHPSDLVGNFLGFRPSTDELVDAFYQEIIEMKDNLAQTKINNY